MAILEWVLERTLGWFSAHKEYERRVRFENHERYLAVYKEFTRLFDLIQFEARIGQRDLLRFKGGTHAALWLCGPEIKAYADEVFDHGRAFWLTREQLKDPLPAAQKQKLAMANGVEWGWFFAQYEILDRKFMRYLNLAK